MKRKKPIKAVTMIEIGLAGVLLAVLALLVFWYTDGLASYSPNALTYQCIGGTTIEYDSEASFRDNNKQALEISDSQGKRQATDTPIIHKGESKVTLAKNMILMVPFDNYDVSRVNRFATLEGTGERITITMERKKTSRYGGFLYDGIDQYIFLESTELTAGNNVIKLPPLSYAIVKYGKSVEYHNSVTGEYNFIPCDEIEVTVKLLTSGDILKLDKDIICINGQDTLLYSAVDNVEVIEMDR